MREALKHYRLLFVVFLAFFVLTGCFSKTVHEKLQWADDKVGEAFDEFGIASSTPTSTSTKFKLPDMPDINLSGIKNKIDDIRGMFTKKGTSTPAVDPIKLEVAITDAKDLSREAKDAIDEWFTTNGFNRYGDPIDTYYTGGTPLFDELTGKAIDRFEYILDKHPGVLKNIKF